MAEKLETNVQYFQMDPKILSIIQSNYMNIHIIEFVCKKIWNLLELYQKYYELTDDMYTILFGSNDVYFGVSYFKGETPNHEEFKRHCDNILNNSMAGGDVNVREQTYMLYSLFDKICNGGIKKCPDLSWWLLELKYHKNNLELLETKTLEDQKMIDYISKIFLTNDINEDVLSYKIKFINAENGTDDFGDILVYIYNHLHDIEDKNSFLSSPSCRLQLPFFVLSYNYRIAFPDRRESRNKSNPSHTLKKQTEYHEKAKEEFILNLEDIVPPLSVREREIYKSDCKLSTGKSCFYISEWNQSMFVNLSSKKELIANISGSTTMLLDGLSIFNFFKHPQEFSQLILSLIIFMYPYDHSIHEILTATQSFVQLSNYSRNMFNYDSHISDDQSVINIINIMKNGIVNNNCKRQDKVIIKNRIKLN